MEIKVLRFGEQASWTGLRLTMYISMYETWFNHVHGLFHAQSWTHAGQTTRSVPLSFMEFMTDWRSATILTLVRWEVKGKDEECLLSLFSLKPTFYLKLPHLSPVSSTSYSRHEYRREKWQFLAQNWHKNHNKITAKTITEINLPRLFENER